ncbi:MAG: RICIN domain-containing protein [Prolixibacteraceae bacterium]|nr:RICIN domain-containing protein [Prolixibacteraceae bacterium]
MSKYAEVNAPVTLWNLIDEDKTQLWTIERKGNDFVIRSCQHQRVLAIHPNDSSIVQQDFEGKASQLWRFAGDNDSIRIINKASGKCLAFIKDSLKIVDRSKYKDQLWKIQTPQSFEKEKLTCNCAENYEFVKAWIESSYPGFADKVNSTTKFQYDSLCNELAAKAKGTESISMCYSIINKYIALFKDNHLGLRRIFGNTYVASNRSPLQGAESFGIRNVDDSTLLFSLPSFYIEKKELIDFLIKTNKNKLLKTPYLVIDVRNNGGGADRSWNNIIPYLYTNPIRFEGNDLILSRELIREGDESNHWNKDYQRLRKLFVEFIEKNNGKFYPNCKGDFVKYNSITPNPKRVAILINGLCGSSCEAFLLSAKQSKKVILLGQPSCGTLDYSNLSNIQCPSFAFQLACPTTRAHWLPEHSVDKEKIKPDIYLEYNQDWIKEAIKALKSDFGHQHSSQ